MNGTTFSDASYAILGGSGGIGSAIAEELHDRGADLWVSSRDTTRYEDLSWADDAEVASLDVEDPETVEAWVREASPARGFDGVVNAVGSIVLKPITRTSYGTWEEVLTKNLTSSFALLKGYLETDPANGGHFLAFSSAAAGTGLPNHGAIAAAKAGLEGLVRSVAADHADRGFQANCISPGLVETPLSEKILRSDRARQRSEAMHPLGTLGDPEDVAKAAVWLLDPANDWVTGQVVGVDGGLREVRPK